jgi:flagellar biosynthetic protein FliQ
MSELDRMIDLGREAIMLTLILASPVLLTGLIVALVVGIFQAATGVQEQTLSLIPKIVAMLAAALLAGPWIMTKLLEFSRTMFGTVP